jgi:hypothetical protein
MFPIGDGSNEAGATFRIHRMLFGERTVPSDLPTTGGATFDATAEFTENENYNISVPSIGGARSATARMIVDWQARTLTGYVRVFPPSGTGTTLQSPIDYPLTGTVSNEGKVIGTISGNGSVGTLNGNIYGPRGAEIGIMYTYGTTEPSGRRADYAGLALGSQ